MAVVGASVDRHRCWIEQRGCSCAALRIPAGGQRVTLHGAAAVDERCRARALADAGDDRDRIPGSGARPHGEAAALRVRLVCKAGSYSIRCGPVYMHTMPAWEILAKDGWNQPEPEIQCRRL